MRIIRGDRLSAPLRAEVLARYVHRWTHENARQSYRGECPACAQSPDRPREAWHAYHLPLISDQEWLRAHAFRVTKSQRLDQRSRWALPALFAEDREVGL